MLFAQKKARAIKDYDIFIKEGIGQNKINFEEGEKDSRIIGDEEFVDKIKFEQEDDERCFDLRSPIQFSSATEVGRLLPIKTSLGVM